MNYSLNHLQELEAESIFIMREVAAQFENPGLLFSGGKDSIVMVHLARKAFWPSKIPFPLVHIDTGHNFDETITFRDDLAQELGARLIVGSVQESIDKGKSVEEKGIGSSRNILQTITLLDTIEKNKFDAMLGGGRRDEEKARAKERFFSHRDEFGQWDPKNQRPELWNLFNGKKKMGEHFRVFPLSNWTELDVWMYIRRDNIKIPSLYYSHDRKVFKRDGMWLAWAPFMAMKDEEILETRTVRCRTIGDMTCTGVVLSEAHNLNEIVAEVAASRETERGNRADDKRSESAMEDRKKEGYF
ncbi:MAG: sulfate adenylyltransferase small subunit [Bacteroidetes bacterium GWF2_43_63]|nr:MAG: sulfate adenylyltransferase small subunit [Bacteroidetes bacterium GWE2_42_42]OFY55029.1 MAG: sulfate adenylyltransferase small subunit [Bacteroidetes bacterium GWF2_43_63]HBG69565.1 sulfate adenylyltransferase subunit CysD [Bacteroidales bacterium]HCB60696.1 sulfate adenylyltransferase subunit CysD [Bacteroidales bacterium]HCY24000.1 sulfate adenylyltransferase subunit CysD [Bacteroidales bacterium]